MRWSSATFLTVSQRGVGGHGGKNGTRQTERVIPRTTCIVGPYLPFKDNTKMPRGLLVFSRLHTSLSGTKRLTCGRLRIVSEGYVGWLVGCFGFNGPLRQYFRLYLAVSQREGERGEKG